MQESKQHVLLVIAVYKAKTLCKFFYLTFTIRSMHGIAYLAVYLDCLCYIYFRERKTTTGSFYMKTELCGKRDPLSV